jgi:hypothetical protein
MMVIRIACILAALAAAAADHARADSRQGKRGSNV